MRAHQVSTWILCCLVASTVGCKLYEPKGLRRNTVTHEVDGGPSNEQVFEVAQEVLLERYSFVSPVRKSGLVMALTPIEMFGANKSRKQITIHIKQNYIGAWEPTVRVVQYIEVGEPLMGADPEGYHPGVAMPVAVHKWQPLSYLPVEANSIRDNILQKLAMPVARS